MAKISWIHFSDLHLNKTGTETKRLRKNLIDYLQKMNKKFDYAFFTGDIRYAPDGNFPDNAGYIIETICSAINLPEKHLFIGKRLNFRHGYKNPRPHFCNRSTLIIHI